MWTKIICPFHEESRPSACYSQDGGFVCFACGIKGTFILLLEEKENLDRRSAIERYEEITGEAYEELPGRSPRLPRGEVSTETRDYERGSALFPTWFRG